MKIKLFSTLLLLTLFITACGASNHANSASNPQSGSSLPAATQLLLGTLKLDSTDQVVTAKQAADLLPLWQTMKVLSESDIAAQQEKDALIEQIQETMTASQMQAIQNMNLSREDMASLMQQQGVTMGGSQRSSSQSGNSSRTGSGSFGPGGGGPPGGMMPPDERGFGGGDQSLSQEQIATAQASRQASGNSIPPMLINALIEYLQKRAGS